MKFIKNAGSNLTLFILTFFTGAALAALLVYYLFSANINLAITQNLNRNAIKSDFVLKIIKSNLSNAEKQQVILNFLQFDCYQIVNHYYFKTNNIDTTKKFSIHATNNLQKAVVR